MPLQESRPIQIMNLPNKNLLLQGLESLTLLKHSKLSLNHPSSQSPPRSSYYKDYSKFRRHFAFKPRTLGFARVFLTNWKMQGEETCIYRCDQLKLSIHNKDSQINVMGKLEAIEEGSDDRNQGSDNTPIQLTLPYFPSFEAMNLIDGNQIASEVLLELGQKIANFPSKKPCVVFVRVGDDLTNFLC